MARCNWILSIVICLAASSLGLQLDRIADVVAKAREPRIRDDDFEWFHRVISTVSGGSVHAELAKAIDFNSTIPLLIGNLTTECLEDVIVIGQAVYKLANNQSSDMEEVLLQIVDSNGARGAGVLRGGLTFYGFKQECDLVNYKVPSRDRPLTTMYSRAYINSKLADKDTVGICPGDRSIHYDLCQPASCTSEDLEFLIAFALNLANITVNPVCAVVSMDDVAIPYTYASWIVGAVIITFIVLVVFAGIVDYFAVVDRKSTSIPVKVVLAFSFYTNTLEVLNMSESRPGQITPLNCVRTLSILWIITCHSIGEVTGVIYNILDFLSIIDYPFFQLLQNAFFSVDSFFFMGGLMVSYMWFKNFNKDRRVLTDGRSWVMFYVHRYLRLSPPYFMTIFFYTYLMLPYLSKFPAYLRYPISQDGCRDYFWRNLLYINNVYDLKNACIGPAWYLGVDMQLYIFSPLILVPLALHPYGVVVPALLWCLSTAANIFTIVDNDWSATYPVRLADLTKDNQGYYQFVYCAAWIRCPVYIQGLVLGWFLHHVKGLKIPKMINAALGGLALALMLTVLFGLFDYNKGGELSLFWRATYSAFSKPAWGLGLTWIVTSSFYGYGGPIDRFMSWPIWNPLGRLSYCMYLVHFLVLALFFALPENAIYYTNFWPAVIFYVIPVAVLSVAVAYIWSVLFEIPIGKLEAILLRPPEKTEKRVSEKVDVEDPWTTQDNFSKKL